LKKNSLVGVGFFVSDIISGELLGHLGPLLETTLQSKSFDTLDDLLGFWVQKL